MSKAISPSCQRPYGLTRVCRVWKIALSSIYYQRKSQSPEQLGRPPRRRGPKGVWSDEALVAGIKHVLATSPWVGEGHRKVWAMLRHRDLATSRPSVDA